MKNLFSALFSIVFLFLVVACTAQNQQVQVVGTNAESYPSVSPQEAYNILTASRKVNGVNVWSKMNIKDLKMFFGMKAQIVSGTLPASGNTSYKNTLVSDNYGLSLIDTSGNKVQLLPKDDLTAYLTKSQFVTDSVNFATNSDIAFLQSQLAASLVAIGQKASSTDLSNLDLQLRSDLALKTDLQTTTTTGKDRIVRSYSIPIGINNDFQSRAITYFLPNLSTEGRYGTDGWHRINFYYLKGASAPANLSEISTQQTVTITGLPPASNVYSDATPTYNASQVVKNGTVMMVLIVGRVIKGYYLEGQSDVIVNKSVEMLRDSLADARNSLINKADVSALSAETAARVSADDALNTSLGQKASASDLSAESAARVAGDNLKWDKSAIDTSKLMYINTPKYLNNFSGIDIISPNDTNSRASFAITTTKNFSDAKIFMHQIGHWTRGYILSCYRKGFVETSATNFNSATNFYSLPQGLVTYSSRFDGTTSTAKKDYSFLFGGLSQSIDSTSLSDAYFGKYLGQSYSYRSRSIDSYAWHSKGYLFLPSLADTATFKTIQVGRANIIDNGTVVIDTFGNQWIKTTKGYTKPIYDYEVKSKPLTLSTSSTPSLDFEQGIQVTYVLTTVQNGDFFGTSTVTNVRDGGIYRIRFVANNTGVVYTFPANVYKKDGTPFGAYAVTSETLIFHAEGVNLYCENK